MSATAAMTEVPRQTQRLSGTPVRWNPAMPRSSQQVPEAVVARLACRVEFG